MVSKTDELNKILQKKGKTTPECLTNLAEQSGVKDPVVFTTPDGIAKVREALDTTLVPENVKAGVNILGVVGSLQDSGTQVPQYPGPYKLDPKTGVQTFETAGKMMTSNLSVGKCTAAIDKNITAENIRSGVSILGVTGILEEKPPLYTGETMVHPASVRQTLATRGKYCGQDIVIEPVSIIENTVGDLLIPMSEPKPIFEWSGNHEIMDADVDFLELGELPQGVRFVSHVGSTSKAGRLNLTLYSYHPTPIELHADNGGGFQSTLFVYPDPSFFADDEQMAVTVKTGGKVVIILARDAYQTFGAAAHFPWIMNDEAAEAWLGILANTTDNRKYVKFGMGNTVSGPVKDQYSEKGYTVVE